MPRKGPWRRSMAGIKSSSNINTRVRVCTGLYYLHLHHTPRHPRPRRQLYSDLLQVEHEVFDGWESQRRVRSFLRPKCPAQVQTRHAAYVPLTASVKTVRLCTFWGCCFQLEELLPDLYCLFACFLACFSLFFSVRDLCLSLYPLKSFTCNCMFSSLAPTFIST